MAKAVPDPAKVHRCGDWCPSLALLQTVRNGYTDGECYRSWQCPAVRDVIRRTCTVGGYNHGGYVLRKHTRDIARALGIHTSTPPDVQLHVIEKTVIARLQAAGVDGTLVDLQRIIAEEMTTRARAIGPPPPGVAKSVLTCLNEQIPIAVAAVARAEVAVRTASGAQMDATYALTVQHLGGHVPDEAQRALSTAEVATATAIRERRAASRTLRLLRERHATESFA
jgi:hypothetical protein